MIGVFGYGVVFPIVCVVIGLLFKRAASLHANRTNGPTVARLGEQAAFDEL